MFTGHCAVPPGCSRWEHGCGSCPDLEAPPAVRHDLTAFNWRRKQPHPRRRSAPRGRRPHAGWRTARNGGCSRRRSRRPGSCRTASTSTRSRRGRRGRHAPSSGSTRTPHVLAFVSNLGAANPHKDFPTLRRISTGWPARDEPAAGAGRRGRRGARRDARSGHAHPAPPLHRRRTAPGRRCTAPPTCMSTPRPAEAFCLAAAEALACGTPVMARRPAAWRRWSSTSAPAWWSRRGDDAGCCRRGDRSARGTRPAGADGCAGGCDRARPLRPRPGGRRPARLVRRTRRRRSRRDDRRTEPPISIVGRGLKAAEDVVVSTPVSPSLSVVIPLVHARGDVVENVGTWTERQSLERERFQVVVAADGAAPEVERRIAGLLAPHDVLARSPGAGYMALYNLGAERAGADWLVLTEAHVLADPGCLAAVVAELEAVAGARRGAARRRRPRAPDALRRAPGRVVRRGVRRAGSSRESGSG